MTSPAQPITDALATVADADTQRQAARIAQDVFADTFRESVAADPAAAATAMHEAETRCLQWCRAGASEDARALRLALLISGLDQWGLAYSQAFELAAIPALSGLIGALRSRLDAEEDARCQRFHALIDAREGDAIDFKVELRRNLHLALWHAMAACEEEAAARSLVQALGSLLLALDERMPELGWRLVADALAHIQIRLVTTTASDLAQQATQDLFAALRQALPEPRYRTIMAHATEAVLAWQQAQRPH